ncbi:SWIB/MDM2 domain-containing protein [Fennellomyces sp. T-0311]|nr:SWIB/MDM2 domain-containing protein [Fennellomyces sp. T-0311]
MDISTFRPRILEILRQADLSTVTIKSVRQKLQAETSDSLDPYKRALRGLIEQCYDAVLDEQNESSASEEAPMGKRTRSPSPPKKIKKTKTTTGEKKGSTKKEKPKKPRKVANPEGNAFTRTWVLSDELAAVTGASALSRPQVVKQLWVYIKKNKLQDQNKKTHIVCDDKLKKLFDNEDYMSAFTMNKYIGKHLLRPAVEEQPHQPEA